MKPEIWEQAKSILPRAQELHGMARAAYLDEACGENAELRRAVEQLLEVDTGAVAFLDREVGQAMTPPATKLDECIGPYRIVEEIGRGGMATVYRASREDGFERQVALKLLHPVLASPENTRRFQREIQILAKLEHPHIARLYDGGETENGQLYLGMEYINGKPLSVYCQERQPSLEERLRLFRKICSAVHYAHQNLVVHRDLKPGNILVTAAGEPKLLDFGVAKLLSPDDDSPPTAATEGLHFLTTGYASPEQLTGKTVTTASDTYSLGVVLYELLTDSRLFPTRRPAGSEEPGKPSGSVTPPVARKLRGDLDTITLMALRREPERRYGSVEQLAEDIDRYLDGLPVKAQKDTAKYRVGKFVRRYRLGVGFAALLFLTVLGFAVAMYVQQQETALERDRAEQVSTFMIEVFAGANPTVRPGEQVTARELLDEGTLRIRNEFSDAPKLRADLLSTIGQSYRELGLADQALPLLEEALKLRTEIWGNRHPRVAQSHAQLGRALYALAEYEQAEIALKNAQELWSNLRGSTTPEVARCLSYLGFIYREQGAYDRSEQSHRDSLAIRQALFGDKHPLVSESLNDLSQVLRYQEEYPEAIVLAKEAAQMDIDTHGKLHPQYLSSASNLAVLLRRTGQVEESEQVFQDAIDIGRQLYPEGHPDLASILSSFAILRANSAELESAQELYEESLHMDEKYRGKDHPNVAATLANLSMVFKSRREYQEALALVSRSLKILEKNGIPDIHKYLETQSKYAFLLWETGDRELAAEMLEKIVEKRRQVYDEDAPIVALDLGNLAFLYETQGRFDPAERFAREALERDRRSFKPGHRNIVNSLWRLASIIEKMGKNTQECEEVAREALLYQSKLLPENHPSLTVLRSILGGCLVNQERYAEAEPLLLEGFEGIREARGDDDWHTQDAQRRLDKLLQARAQ